MALAGTFRQYPLPEVLERLESGQQSGRLVVRGAGRVAHIYIVNGRWVRGERLGMGLTLAEQLVQAELLTPEALHDALGVTIDDTLTLPDEQLLRMLFSSQLLTLEQIREWAAADATSMLNYMLKWTDGEFLFEEGVTAPAGELTLPLALGALLGHAAGATGTSAAAEVTPLSPEAVIAFTDIESTSDVPVQVSRDQWRLLSEVDGQTPLWAIAESLRAPQDVLLRVAGELVAADLATVVGSVSQSAE